MAARLVDLGCLELKSRASSLSIKKSSSFLLEAPTSLGEATATELREMSRKGTLLISKAGSCRLNFSWLLTGAPKEVTEEMAPAMAGLIANCPVSNYRIAGCPEQN